MLYHGLVPAHCRSPPQPEICGSKLFVDLSAENTQEFDGLLFLMDQGLDIGTDLCIFGTNGDDSISGGFGNDVILGLDGKDTIQGSKGAV